MSDVRGRKSEDRGQSCRNWECGLRPVGAYAPEGSREKGIESNLRCLSEIYEFIKH